MSLARGKLVLSNVQGGNLSCMGNIVKRNNTYKRYHTHLDLTCPSLSSTQRVKHSVLRIELKILQASNAYSNTVTFY